MRPPGHCKFKGLKADDHAPVTQELWSAVGITALTRVVGFSQDADSSKKFRVLALFVDSLVIRKGQPAPQSGDARRSPKASAVARH